MSRIIGELLFLLILELLSRFLILSFSTPLYNLLEYIFMLWLLWFNLLYLLIKVLPFKPLLSCLGLLDKERR